MEHQNLVLPVRCFAQGWVGDGDGDGDGNGKWIQLYPYDKWYHPIYGETVIDKEVATKLKSNFDSKVKDAHVFTDYDHGMDRAKGNKASGELVEVDVRDDGLWGLVKFTADARKEIEAGEWNYWSTSHYDTWTHPQTNEKFNYVLDGGGLTNKPWIKGMIPLNFSALVVEKLEVAPEEFQEPGTGIIDPTINEDDSYPNRIDTPPPGEDGSIPSRPVTGGEMVATAEEILAALREKLELSDEADIVQHVGDMNDELEPLRELKKEHSERRQFAEAYPAEFERLQRLEAESRENFAKTFSEKLATRRLTRVTGKDDEGNVKTENTTMGLSAKAIDDVSSIVKKFGENSATLEDFSTVLDSILEDGIVDYGNIGSTREAEVVASPRNAIEGRKMFAEKVQEIVENDSLDFDAALVEAAKKFPELYQSWKSPVNVSA